MFQSLIVLEVGLHHIIVQHYHRMSTPVHIEHKSLFIVLWQRNTVGNIGAFYLCHKAVEILVEQQSAQQIVLRHTQLISCGLVLSHPAWRLPHHCLDSNTIRNHRLASSHERIFEQMLSHASAAMQTSYTQHGQRRVGVLRLVSHLQSLIILAFFHEPFHLHALMEHPVVVGHENGEQHHNQKLQQVLPSEFCKPTFIMRQRLERFHLSCHPHACTP